ncbi:MAG: hypothetical protein QF752_11415, partial [Planctomycetota bacterium]|nr:hypothetical protein [Planctomycetota bacterium]
MHRNQSKRGAVLIITLGVLAVLAVLATSFYKVMSIEKDAATNNQRAIQARMVADAGLEFFSSWVRGRGSVKLYDEPGSSSSWVYGDSPWIPVEDTSNPSFKRSISGKTVSGYVKDYDHLYRLKVLDTGGQLNLNSQNDNFLNEGSPDRCVLYNLGRAIYTLNIKKSIQSVSTGVVDNADRNPLGPNSTAQKATIKKIAQLRNSLPGKVFRSKERLLEVLGQDNYNLIQDFVTIHSFEYPRVLKPNPEMNTDAMYKTNVAGMGYISARLPQFESRYAVNVNTASVPVLMAMFTNLSGYALTTTNYTKSGTTTSHSVYGSSKSAYETRYMKGLTSPISITDAKTLAEAIYKRTHTSNNPFRSWQEFNDYVRYGSSMRPTYSSTTKAWKSANSVFGLSVGQREAVIANANPNALLNRWIPDQARFFRVQKTDMLFYTGEFTFSSMGFFEVTSLGRVYRDNPSTGSSLLQSEAKVSAVLKAWEVDYKSTQKDFLNDMESGNQIQTYPESLYNVMYSTDMHSVQVDGTSTPLDSPALPGNKTYVAKGGSPFDGYLMPTSERLSLKKISSGKIQASFGTSLYTNNTLVTMYLPYRGEAQGKPLEGDSKWMASPIPGYEKGQTWTAKTAGNSVFSDESLLPNGCLFQNNRPRGEEMNFSVAVTKVPRWRPTPNYVNGQFVGYTYPGKKYYALSQNVAHRYGALGFWVKFDGKFARSVLSKESGGVGQIRAGSPLVGAHEPLSYITWFV